MDIPENARHPRFEVVEKVEGWETSLFFELRGVGHHYSWPLRVRYDLAYADAVRCRGDKHADIVVRKRRAQIAAE